MQAARRIRHIGATGRVIMALGGASAIRSGHKVSGSIWAAKNFARPGDKGVTGGTIGWNANYSAAADRTCLLGRAGEQKADYLRTSPARPEFQSPVTSHGLHPVALLSGADSTGVSVAQSFRPNGSIVPKVAIMRRIAAALFGKPSKIIGRMAGTSDRIARTWQGGEGLPGTEALINLIKRDDDMFDAVLDLSERSAVQTLSLSERRFLIHIVEKLTGGRS